MFKAISWGQYLGAVLVLLLLYYAYVALVYYRVELLALAKGKSKAAEPTPAPRPALPSLIGGKGPLIAKPAVTLPAAPPEVTGPAANEQEPTEPTKTETEEEGASQEQEPSEDLPDIEELPALDLPTDELVDNNFGGNQIELLSNDSKAINFTESDVTTASLPTQDAAADYEPNFTIGIAQLGDFLERASEGQASPQKIVEQEPGLANTDLMMSFFQASTQNVQRATSHIYAGLAEAAID